MTKKKSAKEKKGRSFDGGLPYPDCRHFQGIKPCPKGLVCWDCEVSEPQGERILVIKLGAMGDVLRTTPVLPAIKEKFSPCHITWVTEPSSLALLEREPLIDRLLPFSFETVLSLQPEEFDHVYCLDKDPWATAFAVGTKGKNKKGFSGNRWGNLTAFNPESVYALRLGVDDPLKFKGNQKTYQTILFEALSLPLPYGPYRYEATAEEKAYGAKILEERGLTRGRVVGLNTGCGPVFATKAWTEEGYAALAERILSELDLEVLLLGGPDEEERNRSIEARVRGPVKNSGNFHSLRDFAGILSACRLVVTGDTIALHLSVALGTPVVAIFGATCAQEIDLYGLGEKVISSLDCCPCYRDTCLYEKSCMDLLSPEEVFQAVKRVVLGRPRKPGRRKKA